MPAEKPKSIQFNEKLTHEPHEAARGGLGLWWYWILLLIALIIAGIIAVLAYLLCRDKSMSIATGKSTPVE